MPAAGSHVGRWADDMMKRVRGVELCVCVCGRRVKRRIVDALQHDVSGAPVEIFPTTHSNASRHGIS